MGAFAHGVRGQVRMAANTSAITQFLPEDLADFVRLHPEIRIDLTEATSDDIATMVRTGRSDIGLVSSVVTTDGVESLLYRRDTLMVISPAGHPIRTKAVACFDDILAHDLVGLQAGSSIQAFLDEKARGLGEHLSKRVEVMSFDGVRRMVEAGLGIAVLPFGAVEPYANGTTLQATPIDEDWARRELRAVVRSLTVLPKATRLLLHHLCDDLQRLRCPPSGRVTAHQNEGNRLTLTCDGRVPLARRNEKNKFA